MPIWTMCEKGTPGAVLDEAWTNQAKHEIWLKETHKGLVLETREINGYDDSDFYAVVWNAEKQTTEQVTYASTRGWTYPNHASVDATPEVRAAYDASVAAARKVAQERADKFEAATPRVGKTVKIVKAVTRGKNQVAAGEVGTVFWYGEQREFGSFPRGGYKEHTRNLCQYARSLGIGDPRSGYRAGVKLADGRKVFLPALNLEVTQ